MVLFRNLTYKRKYQLLIAIAILFLVLVYYFGIQKTINQYMEYNKLQVNYEEAKEAPQQLAAIKREMDQLNKLTNTMESSGESGQPELLEVITDFSKVNDLVIKDFPQTIEKNVDNYIIEQNKIVVAGDFLEVLKLVYLLEQEKAMGQVVSADFKMTLDKATKKRYLQTSFYIQKIRSNESN